MTKWPRVKVKEVCELIVDCVNRTAPVVDGPTEYRMIRTTNVRDGRINITDCRYVDEATFVHWTRRAAVLEGDVILTREAPIGEVGYVTDMPNIFLGQRLMQYRADRRKIHPRFLFYVFRSPTLQHQFRSHDGSGSVVSHIRVADCHEFEVPVAPLSEQKEIAELLGALDDKIELNRRMNETLEAMARAIFKDWFVDFGPTRAKQEARRAGGATGKAKEAGAKPYLAPDLWSLFPDRLNDKGLPKGWDIGTLADIANVHMGASPSGETYNDQGLGTPLVNGPVEYGEFFLKRIKWTTAPSRLSQRGDLIICVRGSTTGRHAFADGEYCLGRGVAAVRALGDRQEFVESMVLGQMPRLLERVTGSVFPNLGSNDFREFSIIVPTLNLQDSFSLLVRPLRKRVWADVSENVTLAALRDILLPKLMSGEIRVRDAEKLVGEAV
ncbi:MAG: hypothetical protein HOO99_13480 [Hyphomicrobiaceae bacterium]|nr:hypothetical protein [Hyphomicrobiaceae bacterium]